VYEAKDRAGGMLALAPAFRLPEAVVRRDIERIESLGVKIERSHPVAGPPEALLDEGFDAVYVATGFPERARLGIEGEVGAGVFQALDVLERVARGGTVELGVKVLVIGGGNTAMDAARTAKRLAGGPVTVVYRRTRQEMPAEEEEIEAMFAEGIALEELASPTKVVLEDGRVTGLVCVRNELGEPGPDGRRRPVPVEGSAFEIEADSVIVAIGQAPDVSFLDGSSVSVQQNGRIDVDPHTGLAGREGVYAGGDAVRGPAIIIEACADGRRAAEAICGHLGVGFDRPAVELPALSEEEIVAVKRVRAERSAQHGPDLLSPSLREGFDLVEATLTEEAALAEAARCVQCASLCDKCVEVCPNRANYAVSVSPVSLALPVLSCREGGLVAVGEDVFRVEQGRQIVHVDDLCNECGNCATFCVHQGKPYLDKPRLFLDEDAFAREDDSAFYVERHGGGWTIRRRQSGQESRLALVETAGGTAFEFENASLSAKLSPGFQVETMELKRAFEGTFSLVGAAEMAVVLEGVISSFTFLPIAGSHSCKNAD
jgi:putative selenate reductase